MEKKDFKIRTHQAEWAQKRAIARIETDRQIAAITDEKKIILKSLADQHEEAVKKVENDYKERITKAKLKLYERLKEVAAEQDEFENEFRNYVDTLPDPDSCPKTDLD